MTTFNPHLTFDPTYTVPTLAPSRGAIWAGRVLSTIVSLLLGFDATMKLLMVAPVMKASEQLVVIDEGGGRGRPAVYWINLPGLPGETPQNGELLSISAGKPREEAEI